MQPFSNRELYLMNGGNKLYIYKDGFYDVYNATPEEEAEWAKEVVATAISKIDSSENLADLTNAVENLQFHGYDGIQELIMKKLETAGPQRRIAFENILSKKTFE